MTIAHIDPRELTARMRFPALFALADDLIETHTPPA